TLTCVSTTSQWTSIAAASSAYASGEASATALLTGPVAVAAPQLTVNACGTPGVSASCAGVTENGAPGSAASIETGRFPIADTAIGRFVVELRGIVPKSRSWSDGSITTMREPRPVPATSTVRGPAFEVIAIVPALGPCVVGVNRTATAAVPPPAGTAH